MAVTRINQLADEERARFDEWADRWTDVGLRTGHAERAKFESAVRDCYRFAGIPFPDVVVWVPSPMVLALAAPAAAFTIELLDSVSVAVDGAVHDAVRVAVDGAVDGAVHDAVNGAVHDAVDGAVDGAVRVAVRGAVDGAVHDAVRGAVDGAVDGAVRVAVDGAVDGAVHDAVRGAVDGAVDGAVRVAVDGAVRGAVRVAVDGAVRGAVRVAVDGAVDGAVNGAVVRRGVMDAISQSWYRVIGGQFWVGGWYWGTAYTSFFREVCKLELKDDLWDRGRAYEATTESACWWWPHRRFVMVCERPAEIHRELVDPSQPRGWGSHRLHRDDGPAASWPDGWGVWAVHGVRVTRQVVEAPETLTVEHIREEQNAEVRRIMIDRFGAERYLRESNARLLDEDVEWGKLWRVEIPGDEDLVMVEVVNSTPEPDGRKKVYWIRVPPTMRGAREAIAWTFDVPTDDYELAAQT